MYTNLNPGLSNHPCLVDEPSLRSGSSWREQEGKQDSQMSPSFISSDHFRLRNHPDSHSNHVESIPVSPKLSVLPEGSGDSKQMAPGAAICKGSSSLDKSLAKNEQAC